MRSIDPALLACAEQFVRPGDVVWDVGANVGLFSAAAAVRAGANGRVIAFEPDVELVRLLRRSSENWDPSMAPMSALPVAVASESGVRAFNIAGRSRASNALAEYGHSEMGGVAQRQLVPAFNLDRLLTQLPPPQLIKIDVEGAEIEVVAGQDQMLNHVRPVFICEVASRNSAAITAIFVSMSYRLYNGEKQFVAHQPVERASWSTVAIPQEKAAQFG